MLKLITRIQVAKMNMASRVMEWANRENGNEFITYGVLTAVAILIGVFVYMLVTGTLKPFISDQFSSLSGI